MTAGCRFCDDSFRFAVCAPTCPGVTTCVARKRQSSHQCVCESPPCGANSTSSSTSSSTNLTSSVTDNLTTLGASADSTAAIVDVPTGAIIGGVVGFAAIASFLVVALAINLCRKRRQRERLAGDVALQVQPVSRAVMPETSSEYGLMQPHSTQSVSMPNSDPVEAGVYAAIESKNEYESASSPFGDQPQPSSGTINMAQPSGIYADVGSMRDDSMRGEYAPAPPKNEGEGSMEAGVYAIVGESANEYEAPDSALT
jgi:hypothetical protein